MSEHITQNVLNFLRKNLKGKNSLLLGLSGGTDSLALFYLLLVCQKKIPFTFGVAHVDHGWRPESSRESSILRELAEKYSLPFHLKILNSDLHSSNLEAKCREQRISFFDEICRSHGYQALLLGHHLDDQAETVLKNIFEGSHLSSCNGIAEVMKIGSLKIWRPLLTISKANLSHWLEARGHIPFIDETNFDTKYLRARMRGEIIPHLEGIFGKGMKQSLASFGSESQELREFLFDHLSSVLDSVNTSELGSFIDFTSFNNLSLFEIKFIIRQICRIEQCFPSKEIVYGAAVQLLEKGSNKQFAMGQNSIFIDRMRLFVAKNKIQAPSLERVKISGTTHYGDWVIKVESYTGDREPEETNWKDIWFGRGEVLLPQNEEPYRLGPPIMNSSYPRSSSISKWWNQHKIPSFLRQMTPVIWCGGSIVHEFLTGKKSGNTVKNDCWQKISLRRIN